MSCCNICFSDDNTFNKIRFCLNCEKFQCFNCVISFERKCCFCSKQINIFETLLYTQDENLLENINLFLYNKIINFSKKLFPDINILNKILNMWVLSGINNLNSSEILSFTNIYNNILLSKMKNSKLQLLSFLDFLKKYTTNEILDNLLTITKEKKTNIFYDTIEYSLSNNDKFLVYKFKNKKSLTLFLTENKDNIVDEFNIAQLNDNFLYIITKINIDLKTSENIEKIFFSFMSFFIGPLFKTRNDKCTCNDINCKYCNNIYCNVCLNLSHDLKENCVAQHIENLKLCPGCKVLIIKDSGCDDMWCSNCNIFFSWKHGIIRVDRPHNPDYFDFINLKLTNNRMVIKQLLLQELIEEFNSEIGDEDSLLLDCIGNNDFVEQNLFSHINEHIIPHMLKQAFVFNILKIDPIFNRDSIALNNLFSLNEKYKNIIKKICGDVAYKIFWNEIIYENLKIKTNFFKIYYSSITS